MTISQSFQGISSVLSFEAHDVVRDGELISYVMNQNYASLTNVVMERGYG